MNIAPATAEKLATEFPKGTRHKAAMDIAISLIGDGIPPSAVYSTLRNKFPTDVTDKELYNVVDWAVSQNPKPSGFGATAVSVPRFVPSQARQPAAPVKSRSPVEQADWWISGTHVSTDECLRGSPVAIPDSCVDAACLAIGSLYQENDTLNIVCRYLQADEKARPVGSGKMLSRDQWIEYFKTSGVPYSDAGAWIRLNPCSPTGSGKEGAITDADVTSFRFLLLESDVLPLTVQLSLFMRLRLPIAAIILSGGASAHAWLRLDAPNAERYDQMTAVILTLLKPFGIDQANKNPSRLSRLPGATRKIGAHGDGQQRLLWLNPSAPALTDADLTSLADLLQFPAIEEKPMRAIAKRAIERYQEMVKNRGKLGVPIGIPRFDTMTGGLKAGHTIVLAGASGGGKSSFALHIIYAALQKNYGVALFTLEEDCEEIFDKLMVLYTGLNRNRFNTGAFRECDINAMTVASGKICKLPLYIEDSPSLTVEQIRLRTMQLKAAGKIHLAVVDYAQFVNPGITRDSREQQVAGISHGLRALARESRIPFVVLSQLNDEGLLRESRVLAHNANIVLKMELSDDEKKAQLHVRKGRGIPKETYTLDFNGAYCRFEATGTSAKEWDESEIDQADVPRNRYPDN